MWKLESIPTINRYKSRCCDGFMAVYIITIKFSSGILWSRSLWAWKSPAQEGRQGRAHNDRIAEAVAGSLACCWEAVAHTKTETNVIGHLIRRGVRCAYKTGTSRDKITGRKTGVYHPCPDVSHQCTTVVCVVQSITLHSVRVEDSLSSLTYYHRRQ